MRPFVLEDALESLYVQLVAESYNIKSNDFGPGRTIEQLRLLGRKLTAAALIGRLENLLKGKRCLIVLADLSSLEKWDKIIQILPIMKGMCWIVITTRKENIARHCSEKQENIYKLHVLEDRDALDLFAKKVFKEAINLADEYPTLIEEARMILKKCNGFPLAIVTIGAFLAKQPKTPIVWRKMNENISAELEINPELGIIKTILMKSYDGLSYHLKSCFLYMSIFPEDYNISRRRLVHRWNAEGYSSEILGKSMREIADSYFMKLIERSILLPPKESVGSRKGISSCKFHGIMRDISIIKAMEENLVFIMDERHNSNTQGTIRHLAISNNWEGDQSEFESIVDLSHIWSLTVFGKWRPFYISDKMKLLRVLDLEGTQGLLDHHLEQIGKLFHLNYLSLRKCIGVFHLPESLGNLKQLQTLDLTDTNIMILPQSITKLRKLQYIHAGNRWTYVCSYDELVEEMVQYFPELIQNKRCAWALMLMAFCFSCCCPKLGESILKTGNDLNRCDVWTFYCCAVFPFLARLVGPSGVVVPRGLGRLKVLHTLGVVNIAQGKTVLQDIRRLTRLHKLSVTGINKKNCQEFCSTIAGLSCLESLLVDSGEEAGLRGCLDGLSSPPKNLPLGKMPEWVAGLQNLVKLKLKSTRLTEVDGTIQVLGKLPNLLILRLLDESFEAREPHLFSCLVGTIKSLTVLELDYPCIGSLEFKEGTAPKLELLLPNGSFSVSGISYLPSLKEALIYDDQYRSELVEAVRAQITSNPKKPVLKIIKRADDEL